MTESLVSIITPVYNCRDVVEETVRSVLSQTFPQWEMIICDDGSDDGTGEIVDRVSREDDRIRAIHQPSSGLPAAARNRALKEAAGKYIAFLDGDDKWAPEKLELQIEYLESHPECKAVHTSFELAGEPDVVRFHRRILEKSNHNEADFDTLFLKCVVHISTLMIRRDLLEEIGLFDEDPGLRGVEDYDFLLRVSSNGPIHHIRKPLSFYRLSPESVLHSKTYNRFEREMNLLEKVKKIGLERDPGRIRKREAAIYYNRGINRLYHYGGPFRVDFREAFRRDRLNPKMIVTLVSCFLPAPLLRVWLRFLLAVKKNF